MLCRGCLEPTRGPAAQRLPQRSGPGVLHCELTRLASDAHCPLMRSVRQPPRASTPAPPPAPPPAPLPRSGAAARHPSWRLRVASVWRCRSGVPSLRRWGVEGRPDRTRVPPASWQNSRMAEAATCCLRRPYEGKDGRVDCCVWDIRSVLASYRDLLVHYKQYRKQIEFTHQRHAKKEHTNSDPSLSPIDIRTSKSPIFPC